jgi:hypothetical protein
MASPRPPKKSGTLEIRLPHAEKQAFMARCQADGLTASEAVRGFIEGRLTRPAKRRTLGWTVAAALGAGLALGAVAAPSLADTASRAVHSGDARTSADRADFDRLDRNGDGVVSFAEYRRR